MTEKTTAPKASSHQSQTEKPMPKSVKKRRAKKGAQATAATQICDPAESLTATHNQTRGPKKPPKTAAKEKPKKAPVSNKTADTH